MERQALLEPAALWHRSGGRIGASRRRFRTQHFRLAFLARETRTAPRHVGCHCEESKSSGGDGESGGGERQPGIRWIKPRDRAGWKGNRAREVVRRRLDLFRLRKTYGRHAPANCG